MPTYTKGLIKHSVLKRIQNDEQLSVISFIGNSGGLLGLFLGMSFVSLFEIVYFFADFVMSKMFQFSLKQSRLTKLEHEQT